MVFLGLHTLSLPLGVLIVLISDINTEKSHTVKQIQLIYKKIKEKAQKNPLLISGLYLLSNGIGKPNIIIN
jgi:hypothetical protein